MGTEESMPGLSYYIWEQKGNWGNSPNISEVCHLNTSELEWRAVWEDNSEYGFWQCDAYIIPEGRSHGETKQLFENSESKLRTEVGCRGKNLEVINKEVTAGTVGMKLFLTEKTMLKISLKKRIHIVWLMYGHLPI